MTAEQFFDHIEAGHVDIRFTEQRRHAISAIDPKGPALFLTVEDEGDGLSLDNAYLVDADLREHALTLAQQFAVIAALRRES